MNKPTFIVIQKDIRTWIYVTVILYGLIMVDANIPLKIMLLGFSGVALLNSVFGYNLWVSSVYVKQSSESIREIHAKALEIKTGIFIKMSMLTLGLLLWIALYLWFV